MNTVAIVRNAAEELGLLSDAGRLGQLDSLSLMDFVTALETTTGLSIPTASLHEENFESLETVAEMLDDLRSGR